MKKTTLSVMLLCAAVALSACAQPQSRGVYNQSEVGKQTDVELGKIIGVRHVKVQAQDTGVGTLGGAAAGGVAGSTAGGGKGAILTAIAGAVVGGIAGDAAERALRNEIGIEYVIRKDDGQTVSIVQNIGKDDKPLHVGERVMIQTDGSYQRASGKHKSQYQRVLPLDDSEGK
ncbi:MAG: hypothetical protein KGL10_09590 [Alphaproteobacteria bacterium]|nr:hypothetical protein [Alphaproteobacteria bacterium]